MEPAASEVRDGVNICPLTTDKILARLSNESLIFPNLDCTLLQVCTYSFTLCLFGFMLPSLFLLAVILVLHCSVNVWLRMCSLG